MKLLLSIFAILSIASSGFAAKIGGTFIQNLDADPTTLHPINSSDIYSKSVHSYALDTLMSNDPETRPSQGKDVHQDQHGKHPAPAPDNARSSDRLTKSDKESGKAV